MALTSTPLSNPIGAAIVKESASGGTGSGTATADNDVRAGATTVYQVDVDNTANNAAVFTKLYDAAAPSVGTAVPDYVFKVPASSRKVFTLDLSGVAFATGLSFTTTSAGGTSGSTGPASAVVVRVLCS